MIFVNIMQYFSNIFKDIVSGWERIVEKDIARKHPKSEESDRLKEFCKTFFILHTQTGFCWNIKLFLKCRKIKFAWKQSTRWIRNVLSIFFRHTCALNLAKTSNDHAREPRKINDEKRYLHKRCNEKYKNIGETI